MGYISNLQYNDIILNSMKKNMQGIKLNINSRVIDNILKQYLLYVKYYKPPVYIKRSGVAVQWSRPAYLFSAKLSDILKIDKLIILNFFLALFDLSKAGKIEYKLYAPETAASGATAKKRVTSLIPVDMPKNINAGLRNVAIVAVAVSVIYVIHKFKKG